MKSLITLACLLSITFSLSTLAQVSIIGFDIPGLHQSDGQGVYDIIMNKTLIKSGKAKIERLPPIRAEKAFANCQNCCLSPANKNPEFYEYDSSVTASEPMNIAKVYIFSGPNKPVINSLAKLKGKNVGARRGMPYGKSFDNAGLNTSLVSDISKNIKKIQDNRLDAFIAYIPDAYIEFKAMGISPLPHAKDQPVAVHPDSMICRGVPKGFLEDFNQAIKSMRTSGELKTILGDGYVAQ